ncbi:hypothetical protein GY45DRAFT_1325581 [Cubamyces sp. BRFM 1775]|nr:hypothetical protein GY45DRAFT_1325581 [Cubamyces sp. BRFM 1775]
MGETTMRTSTRRKHCTVKQNVDDDASVMSRTSTLVDGRSRNTPPSKASHSSRTKADATLTDSTASFANLAARAGWKSPTATRPSFG